MDKLMNMGNSIMNRMSEATLCASFQVIKQFIGPYIKDFGTHNVKELSLGSGTIELNNLELNEALINEKFIDTSQIRLQSGSINTLKSQISLSSKNPRNLEIEGLDLTFVVTSKTEARGAATAQEIQRNHEKNKNSNEELHQRSMVGSESLLFSDVCSEDQGFRDVQASANENCDIEKYENDRESPSIDAGLNKDGIDMVRMTIKEQIHSLGFRASHVNVRLRVAPPGTTIEKDKPLPPNTVEMLFNLQNDVVITDANSTDMSQIGDSFRKRITFDSIRVALYDLKVQETNTLAKESISELNSPRSPLLQVQIVKLSDIILSNEKGATNEDVTSRPLNEIEVSYFDTPSTSSGINTIPRWKVLTSLNPFHSILCPSQMSRLATFLGVFLNVPDATTQLGVVKEMTPVCPSEFRISCPGAFLYILQQDSPQAICNCWKPENKMDLNMLNDNSLYSLTVREVRLLIISPAPNLTNDEKYRLVFNRYGGRFAAVSLENIQIFEKRPNYPLLTLLELGAPSNQHRKYGASITIQTTCPMTAELARQCGVDVSENYKNNIVRQAICIDLVKTISLQCDVEVLERLITFWKVIEHIAASKLDFQRRRKQHVSEEISVSSKDGYEKYEVFLTTDASIPQISIDVQFPVARRPSLDLYGPLTQQLFDSMSMGSSSSRFSNVPRRFTKRSNNQSKCSSEFNEAATSSSNINFENISAVHSHLHLSKSLAFIVNDLTFRTDHRTDVLLFDALSASLQLRDVLDSPSINAYEKRSGASSTTLASISFHPDPQRNRDHQMGLRKPSCTIRINSNLNPYMPPTSKQDLRDNQYSEEYSKGNNKKESKTDNDNLNEKDFLFEASSLDNSNKELELIKRSPIHITLDIYAIEIKSLHKDELLLIGYLADEMLICAGRAIKKLDQDEIDTLEEVTLFANTMDDNDDTRSDLDLKNTTRVFYEANSGDVYYEEPLTPGFVNDVWEDHTQNNVPNIRSDDLLSFGGDPPDSDARASQLALEQIASAVTFQLSVHRADVIIHAPRLSSAGVAISEPLLMTRSLATRNTYSESHLYHRYVIQASQVFLFVYSYTFPERTLTHNFINMRVQDAKMSESLCKLPVRSQFFKFNSQDYSTGATPQWGGSVPLIRNYAGLYNRSYKISYVRPIKFASVCILRKTDTVMKSIDTDVTIKLDRVAVIHQAAHNGDHWLLVLLGFIDDTPEKCLESEWTSNGIDVNSKDANYGVHDSEPSYSDDELKSDNYDDETCSNIRQIEPFTTTTRVRLHAVDTLIEYQPFGYSCRVVVIAPALSLDTGDLMGLSNRCIISIGVVEQASMLLHNHFTKDLVTHYDNGNSRIPTMEKGIEEDLQRLGFVPVLVMSPWKPSGIVDAQAMNAHSEISLRFAHSPQKPLVVELTNLKCTMEVASDSFYLLQTVLEHFTQGVDLKFLPSPYSFVEFGIKALIERNEVTSSDEPTVQILVNNYTERILKLIEERIQDRGSYRKGYFSVGETSGATSQFNRKQKSYTRDEDDSFDNYNSPGEFRESNTQRLKNTAKENCMRTCIAPHYEDIDDGFVNIENVDPRVDHIWTFGSSWKGTGDSNGEDTETFNLLNLFKENYHFSLRNTTSMKHAGKSCHIHPLVMFPPLDMEIVVSSCQGIVRLYGGLDFPGLDMNEKTYQSHFRFDSNHFSDIYGGGPNSRKMYQSRRDPMAVIEAHFQGIFAQIDLFKEGYDRSMRLILHVENSEILDKIKGSSVRTLLMCSVPQELRDNDGYMFEVKWITVIPSLGAMTKSIIPEQELYINIQPIMITAHRCAIMLLHEFFSLPGDHIQGKLGITSPKSTMFFNRFVIHQVNVSINIEYEKRYSPLPNISSLREREVTELWDLMPSFIQRPRIMLPTICLTGVHLDDLPGRILTEILSQIKSLEAILIFLCGVEPVHTINEAGRSVVDLLVKPLDTYKRNGSLYASISKALQRFGGSLGCEAVRLAAGGTNYMHRVTQLCSGVALPSRITPGDQPRDLTEGLSRGMREFSSGIGSFGDVFQFCVYNDHGGLMPLTLAPLSLADGIFRALTEILRGARNSINSDNRLLEEKLYKPNYDD